MNSGQLWLPACIQGSQHSIVEVHEPLPPTKKHSHPDLTRRTTTFPQKLNWDHGCCSMVEHLPRMCKTQHSIPRTGDKSPVMTPNPLPFQDGWEVPRGVLFSFISVTPQLLTVTVPNLTQPQRLHPCHGVLVMEGRLLCAGPHTDGCVYAHISLSGWMWVLLGSPLTEQEMEGSGA